MKSEYQKETTFIAKKLLTSINPVMEYDNLVNRGLITNEILVAYDGMYKTNCKDIVVEYEDEKYYVLPVADYSKTMVLNGDLIRKGENPLGCANILNLDSNIMSMLPRYIKGNICDSGLEKLLTFIKKNEKIKKLNIATTPYSFEDSLNATGMKNTSKVYEALLAYAIISRVSYNDFVEKRFEPKANDYILADEIFNGMQKNRSKYLKEERQAKAIYCFLLETYILQFKYNSFNEKLDKLIDFLNYELGLYFEFGMNMAIGYFRRDSKEIVDFFQKVQPNSIKESKLKDIEGMAWDLYHYWNIPNEMANDYNERNAVSMIYIVTHDDKFAQLIKSNPIKRIFLYNDKAYTKYSENVIDKIPDEKVKMLDANTDNRQSLIENLDLNCLVQRLEKTFLDLAV